jgi:hypothetical protein
MHFRCTNFRGFDRINENHEYSVFNYNKNKFTLFYNDLILVIDVQKMMDEYYNITTHTGFTTTELLSTKWINTTFEVSENWTSPSPSSVTQMTLMINWSP